MSREHTLPRPIVAALLAALAPSCIAHTDFARNAPGIVELEPPPTNLESKTPEAPKDPGETGLVIAADAIPFLGGWGKIGAGAYGYYAFAAQVGLYPFSIDKSHQGGWLVAQTLGGSIRPQLGWAFARVTSPGASERVDVGPGWVDLQFTFMDPKERFYGASIAPGLTWDFTRKVWGPQLSACSGIPLLFSLCGRTTYAFGDGFGLAFYFVMHGYGELTWSR